MKTPWFFATDLRPGEVELAPSEAVHAAGSRRLQSGDPLVLFDGAGRIATGVLAGKNGGAGGQHRRSAKNRTLRPLCARINSVETVPPLAAQLTLICGTCKGERLDFLVEKCAELGAAEIIFPAYERSVVHVGENHLSKLRRTAVEACKQCGLAWLPRVERAGDVISVSRNWKAANPGAPLYVADPDADSPTLATVLHRDRPRRLAVVIGPEGGLAPAELDQLREVGGVLVRLGTNLLRVETAAAATAAGVADFEAALRRQAGNAPSAPR